MRRRERAASAPIAREAKERTNEQIDSIRSIDLLVAGSSDSGAGGNISRPATMAGRHDRPHPQMSGLSQGRHAGDGQQSFLQIQSFDGRSEVLLTTAPGPG